MPVIQLVPASQNSPESNSEQVIAVTSPESVLGWLPGARANGMSAYQVAVTNGFVGTEAQWLASLVGPKGDPGTTAVDILSTDPNNNLTIGTDGKLVAVTKLSSTNW